MNPNEEKERALWRQQKHLEIKKELRSNEKFMQFLEKAYPFSREGFIDEYAGEKVDWIEWGPTHIRWNEKEDLQWLNDATAPLKEIQQKKLFDIQCLWRAEKMNLPQIKTTFDFKYWEDNILNCPFVQPVTQTEVDLYIQYLQSENFENQQGWFDRWQDYEQIKEAYNSTNANRNFPDWYDFHNGRTGLSVYLILPDIRGSKEEFYLNLFRQETFKKAEQQKKKEQEQPILAGAKTDQRPWLNYHQKGWLTWFVTTYEDKQTQEFFKRYGGENPFNDQDEFIENDLRLLEHADRTIPIQGWFDWKEAIHKAADRYRREKIIESLPSAFEQYHIHLEMKLSFEETTPIFTLNDWYHKAILRGRELNGEPLNFDF